MRHDSAARTRSYLRHGLIGAFAFAIVASASPAVAQVRAKVKPTAEVRAKTRAKKSFARDKRRMTKVKEVKRLSDMLASKSRLTGKLGEQASAWKATKEGPKHSKLDLGKGLSLKLGIHRYDLPAAIGGTRVKLLDVSVSRNGKSKSLLGGSDVPVSIGDDSSYSYRRGAIRWTGPESRFSVLTLLHERGHSFDFSKASPKAKEKFIEVYERVSQRKQLSSSEHRLLVGLERSAWAHALRSARALKREGFDVLQGVSVKEISRAINSNLKGYYTYSGDAP